MQDFIIPGQIKTIHKIIHKTWIFIIKAQKELMNWRKHKKEGKIEKMDGLDRPWFPFKVYVSMKLYVSLMNMSSDYLSV